MNSPLPNHANEDRGPFSFVCEQARGPFAWRSSSAQAQLDSTQKRLFPPSPLPVKRPFLPSFLRFFSMINNVRSKIERRGSFLLTFLVRKREKSLQLLGGGGGGGLRGLSPFSCFSSFQFCSLFPSHANGLLRPCYATFLTERGL